jgi:alpha-glucosidase
MPQNFRFIAMVVAGVCLALSASRAQERTEDAEGHLWWQHAVFYEVYPRSFADSNGDGIGDLRGIESKLDYLKQLGVDAIWITPCYPSPQVDFGYDVSDYENIDPMYGSLGDFDHLARAAKKKHIRILMDFVINHTSDQHPWFLDSKSSRLVHLAGRQRGRSTSQQLDLRLWGFHLEVRSHNRSVLLPLLCQRPA